MNIGSAGGAESTGHGAVCGFDCTVNLTQAPHAPAGLRNRTGFRGMNKIMEKTIQAKSWTRGHVIDVTLAKGIGWGLMGGLAGTLVMDLILIGTLSAVGLPALSCFSIIGDTVAGFLALLGADLAGGIPLGIATHYLIGPAIGAIFGAAVIKVAALRVRTIKKGIGLAVLYVEILSQPLLAMTPILLKMTALGTLQWFGISFLMHLIAGVVLGSVLYLGLSPETRGAR